MELRGGSQTAVDELFALFYEELRELARRHHQRWGEDSSLNTTGLVHEAYLKLVGRDGTDLESRAHFFALASRAMRHILCNHVRDRRALKRGGALQRLPLGEGTVQATRANPDADATDALVALDDALKRLEQLDPRRSQVVECRFFGGLTVEETAMALRVSARTVKRDWAVAQAWLLREMKEGA